MKDKQRGVTHECRSDLQFFVCKHELGVSPIFKASGICHPLPLYFGDMRRRRPFIVWRLLLWFLSLLTWEQLRCVFNAGSFGKGCIKLLVFHGPCTCKQPAAQRPSLLLVSW